MKNIINSVKHTQNKIITYFTTKRKNLNKNILIGTCSSSLEVMKIKFELKKKHFHARQSLWMRTLYISLDVTNWGEECSLRTNLTSDLALSCLKTCNFLKLLKFNLEIILEPKISILQCRRFKITPHVKFKNCPFSGLFKIFLIFIKRYLCIDNLLPKTNFYVSKYLKYQLTQNPVLLINVDHGK